MTELLIDFDPKYLPILDIFKAKADIRYYLCGVYVEKAPQGGVYLVGCDGHTMAVIYDKTGSIEGADSAIIRVEPGLVGGAKRAATASRKDKLEYRVIVRGTRALVAVPGANEYELFIQPGKCVIEGTFPKWRTVLPDFTKLQPGAGAECAVNAIYMARFAKVLANEKRFCGISFWQETPAKPFVIQVERLPEAVFVVMPMRGQGNFANFAAFQTVPADAPKVMEPEVA